MHLVVMTGVLMIVSLSLSWTIQVSADFSIPQQEDRHQREAAASLLKEAEALRTHLLRTIKATSDRAAREPSINFRDLEPLQQTLLHLHAAQVNVEMALGEVDRAVDPQKEDRRRELTESLTTLRDRIANARSALQQKPSGAAPAPE